MCLKRGSGYVGVTVGYDVILCNLAFEWGFTNSSLSFTRTVPMDGPQCVTCLTYQEFEELRIFYLCVSSIMYKGAH